MKILITCDDVWHPAEVIEKGLQFLKKDGHELHFIKDAKDILTPEYVRQYPLWINAKMDQIGSHNQHVWFEEGIAEFTVKDAEAYVREGGGFLALHAGCSYFLDASAEYCRFLGCAFVKHPPRCPVTVRPIKPHPVTGGVAEFSVRDEHYEIHLLAEDAHVLLQSVSDTGGTQTAGYVRELGKGRVCALTPGHILSVFDHPMYQKIIRQAVLWAAKKENVL